MNNKYISLTYVYQNSVECNYLHSTVIIHIHINFYFYKLSLTDNVALNNHRRYNSAEDGQKLRQARGPGGIQPTIDQR